jgi:NADH dehydrogenase/NADH:ubiquinone oxidoreductase subunit G
MSTVTLKIDGTEVQAREGATVLEAAQGAGISIPALCHHKDLEPFGACRLCLVEVDQKGWTRLVVSCVFEVAEGLVVRTRSEKVDRMRKTILELLMAHAPDAPALQALAAEYGARRDRFGQEGSFCIHCGLCVRYCAEVKGAAAVGFVERGVEKEISFVPDIAARMCNDCKECFPLCPTSYLQAVFVLTEALAFPASSPPAATE